MKKCCLKNVSLKIRGTNFNNISVNIILLIFFSIPFSFQCDSGNVYKKESLHLVEHDELLKYILQKNGQVYSGSNYQNEFGEKISRDSIIKLFNMCDTAYVLDFYANDPGEIKMAVLRKSNKKDLNFMEEVNQLINEQPEVKPVEVKCNQLEKLLDDVLKSDQENRMIRDYAYQDSIDKKNLSIVISILENCGIPSKEEVGNKNIYAIWSVLQHSSYKYLKAYFPILKESAEAGNLDMSAIATMKDRILMYEHRFSR